MKRIAVGIVGAGFIGPAHVEALRRLPGVEVLALAGANAAAARAKAEQLGIGLGFGDYRELLAREEIEVVHVCTPNHLHYRMTRDALEAGKHVVCEKPLAVEAREARELVELAVARRRVNAVHFNVRYYPLMRQLKRMVEKGEMGRIFSIHGSYLQDWLFYETDYNWRLEPEMSGPSRAVADIGSHWMDLVEHVSGLRAVEVFADFATVHKRRKKPLRPVETYAGKILRPEDYAEVAVETEDYATVLLRFDTGARGALTVSQVSAGRKNRISFELDGSRRAAAWNSESPNALWIGRRDGPNEELMKDPSLVDPEVRSLIDFPGG
ncbi:MAG TPA: Gfo/Idh/MocA family oxidoreductase, partial [Anaeromyxobacteraceae bacterium]|nr:Gfo/Idh/MocA family oxidoreductase [Anaeromyxobacteraceae bacterium]